MRHHRQLRPTEQLIMIAVTGSTTPLNFAQLAEETNSSPYTLQASTQRLVRRGLLARRNGSDGMSTFCVADAKGVGQ